MPMEKAKIVNTATGKSIGVMFNPPSLKISSSNSYADPKTPGGNQERQQYIKNNSDILTVEFFFDTTRQGTNVKTIVDPILDLAKVPKNAKEPPKLIFAWGKFTFDCVIISIDHCYDYFNSFGEALRATLTVKFRRCEPVGKAKAEPAKSSVADTAKEVVKAGQDITCFCAEPKDWRAVAELNGIDNPFIVGFGEMVGESLLMP